MAKANQFMLKLATGLAALTLSLSAHAVVVDLFSTDQGPHADTTATAGDTGTTILSGVGSSVGVADPTILGGNRDLFVSLLSSSNAAFNTSIAVAGGILGFSVDAGARGRGQIQWDGGANTDATIDYTGLGNLNLGLGNIAIDILYSDGGFNFEITIYTDASNWTNISFISNAHPVPATSTMPISAWSTLALCGAVNPAPGVASITCAQGNTAPADTSNVGAIVADLDRLGGTTSIDLLLDNINTVPEPGILALIAAGLLGLFGVARRRNSVA